MKIIKNNKDTDKVFPIRTTCEYCNSELEIDKEDVFFSDGDYVYVCPVCNEENQIVNYSVINYPHDFSYMCPECMGGYISDEFINNRIKEGIEFLQNHPEEDYWYEELGSVFMCILKSDNKYTLNVTSDYYLLELPINN